MSIFDVGKVCVFSSVKAQLKKDGKPLKSVKVIRRWNWNKENEDTTTTDENGVFAFPAVFESSISRLFPVELVVGQQLSVLVEGEEVVFWTNAKREPEENAEYGGATFNIICDLKDEERLIEDYGSLMVTVCRLNEGESK